jgi:ABC-type uncharacterized transport system fused permease/ATPase subunit
MCIICVELLKQKMSMPEAARNLRELISLPDRIAKKHQEELYKALDETDLDALDRIIIEGSDEED